MWQNCLDTTAVLNGVNEAWRHPAERSSRYLKPHSHILMQRKYFFDVSSMIDLFFIEDYQGRYALETGITVKNFRMLINGKTIYDTSINGKRDFDFATSNKPF